MPKRKSPDSGIDAGCDAKRPHKRHDAKPPYPYAGMMAVAIWYSPTRALTVQEIGSSLRLMFPAFSLLSQKDWCATLRHNLSANAAFIRLCDKSSAKRCKWQVDLLRLDPVLLRRQHSRKPSILSYAECLLDHLGLPPLDLDLSEARYSYHMAASSLHTLSDKHIIPLQPLLPRTSSVQYPAAGSTTQYPGASTMQYPAASTMQYPAASTSQYPAASTTQYPVASTSQYPATSTMQYPAASTTQYPAASSSQYPAASTTQYPAASTSQYPAASTTQYPAASTSQYQAAMQYVHQDASITQYRSSYPSAVSSSWSTSAFKPVQKTSTSQSQTASTMQYPISYLSQCGSSTQYPTSVFSAQYPTSVSSQYPNPSLQRYPTSLHSSSPADPSTSQQQTTGNWSSYPWVQLIQPIAPHNSPVDTLECTVSTHKEQQLVVKPVIKEEESPDSGLSMEAIPVHRPVRRRLLY